MFIYNIKFRFSLYMSIFKYIVIPDVHGRDFWRDVVSEYLASDVKFIFLGDYLDPYEYEEIDNEQTYIAIDKDKRIVRLQIDTQTLDCTELKIYIMTEGSKRKLDIQKVGNLITSTFNLEDNSIDLIIEK